MDEIIRPSLPLDIVFWSQGSIIKEESLEKKVLLLEISSSAYVYALQQPQESSAEKDQAILSIWDIAFKKSIWKASFLSILRGRAEESVHEKNDDNRVSRKTDESSASRSDVLTDIRRFSCYDPDGRFSGSKSSISYLYERCNPHTVIITCKSGIIFYNYLSRSSHFIYPSDIDAKLIHYSEFISSNLLAIGCSDGALRIWDCESWKMIPLRGKFDYHAKAADIYCIKNLIHTKLSVNNDGKEHFRFLSLGSDGLAFLWEGEIVGNILVAEHPAGRLDDSQGGKISLLGNALSSSITVGGTSNLFVERSRNGFNLAIVGVDHVLRVWSLTNINGSARAVAAAMVAQPSSLKTRSSIAFTSTATSDPLIDIPKLPIMSCLRLDSCLPASLTRFSSCSIISHPMFPQPTYAIAVGSSIAIIQSKDASYDDSRVNDASAVTCLYEISLPLLLGLHLSASYHTEKEVSSKSDSNSSKPRRSSTLANSYANIFGRECSSLRCYSLQVSALYPDCLLLGTSLGMMMVRFGPSQLCSRIARHPSWKNLLVYRDHRIIECQVIVPESITPLPPTTAVGPSQRSIHLLVSADGGISTEKLDLGSNIAYHEEASNTSGSSSSRSNELHASTAAFLSSLRPSSPIIATAPGCTMPELSVSPTGKYLAAIWENTNYLIIQVTQTSSIMSLREVERGLCLSFAWIGQQDDYILITPTYVVDDPRSSRQATKLQAVGKRSSISALFTSKAEEETSEPEIIHPSTMIAKRLEVDRASGKEQVIVRMLQISKDKLAASTSAAVLSSFDMNQAKHLFSGNLVCCNYVSAASIQAAGEHRSSFLPADRARLIALTSTSGSNEVSIACVGPVLPACEMLNWDHPHGLVAILVQHSIRVLRLDRRGEDLSLDCLATIPIDHSMRSIVCTMSWQAQSAGLLLVSSSISTSIISFPITAADSVQDLGGDSWRDCYDLFPIASATRELNRPMGHYEALYHDIDSIVLISPIDLSIIALSGSQLPLAVFHRQLSIGTRAAIDKVISLMQTLPSDQHDALALLLWKR
jgi:hypothetical protein